jgi:hypothetical protein
MIGFGLSRLPWFGPGSSGRPRVVVASFLPTALLSSESQILAVREIGFVLED